MRLHIHHQSRFTYPTRTVHRYNELRLSPLDQPGQRVVQHQITITPTAILRPHLDFYGNRVQTLELVDPHDSLEIVAESLVETEAETEVDRLLFEETAEAVTAGASPSVETWEFLLETSLVPRDPELWRFGVDVTEGISGNWWRAMAVSRAIFEKMRYVSASTSTRTDALEAFRQGGGVCQDFAHVFLAVARLLQIPSRYVSGYLFVGAGGQSASVVESGLATHAWVEVFVDGYGWRGWDPTHHCAIDERYVILARGRDYRDVSPVTGAYMGGAVGVMEVAVAIRAA